MISAVTVCLIAGTACGFSPLLNHTVPNRIAEAGERKTEQSVTCKMTFLQGNLCADFVWGTEPNGNDEGSMKIYFWYKNQPDVFVDLGLFQPGVKLWMPDMGHGSQKVKVQPAVDAQGKTVVGVYDATEIMFVMGGDWEIQFQLNDRTGKVLEVQKVPYSAQ